MKNKLVASAFVLGFLFAPISAFADSVTTTQGGTPVYSCNPGDTKDANLCSHESPSTEQTYSAQGSDVITYCDYSQAPAFVAQRYSGVHTQHISKWDDGNNIYCGVMSAGGSQLDGYYTTQTKVVTTYTCNAGDTLNGLNCVHVLPASISTYAPTVSGSNGGSLIASVGGFLSPVFTFLHEKLLPAIGLLVVLGIGIRLSIKAVRKFSKVA